MESCFGCVSGWWLVRDSALGIRPTLHGYAYEEITTSPVLNFVAINTFDGLGRVSRDEIADGSSNVYKDTTYDGLGRISTVSNPYRSTSESTYGITTYIYDGLNRKTLVTEP